MRTPESLSRVNDTSKMIVRYSICYVSDFEGLQDGYSQLTDDQRTAMKYMLDEILTKHGTDFTELVNNLNLAEVNCCAALESVLREMVSDKKCNWGRLVTVCAFSGVMVKTCIALGSNPEIIVNQIISTCENFITTRFGEWIDDQGGWESFERQFATNKSQSTPTWHELLRQGIYAVTSAVSVR